MWNKIVEFWDTYVINCDKALRDIFSKTCVVCLSSYAIGKCPNYNNEIHKEWREMYRQQAFGDRCLAKREKVLKRYRGERREALLAGFFRRRDRFQARMIGWRLSLINRSWKRIL